MTAEEKEYTFGPFRLDAVREQLWRGNEEIRLAPKVFGVLRYLVEHPGEIVTKNALLESMWPDLHVTDTVLAVHIGKAREALSDDSKKPRFIETVHRRGYRFLLPATHDFRRRVAVLQQDIRFCETADGVRIAYSTMGQGSPLVIPPQLVTHLEADLTEGPLGDVYEALAQHHTLVRFDMRGTGLSDRDVSLSSEEAIFDLEAVVDALNLRRFAMYGFSAGGRRILQYYARHPDRVSHLVFYGTDPGPISDERKKQRDVTLAVIRASWEVGSKLIVERLMPYSGTREDIERLARWLRLSVTSDVAQRLIEFRQQRADLKPLCKKVSVPTLVIHRRGDRIPFAGARELASRIRGAVFMPLDGYNHLPATHDEAMELVTPIVEFLAKAPERSGTSPLEADVPVVLLYVDMTGGRSLKQRLNDRALQRLLVPYMDTVRRAIDSYNGNEVNHTGKGIAAWFFSASRAVGCALQIQHALAQRNAANPDDSVKSRIGLNAGEPIAEKRELFAASVEQARQICARAKTGQILVSEVVRQLVPGKGFVFELLGMKTLKGFDEPVALYTLVHDRATSVQAHRRPKTAR